MLYKKKLILTVGMFLILLNTNTFTDHISGKSFNLEVYSSPDKGDETLSANEPPDKSINNDKKFAIITFDDGKKGQIINTKPILDEYDFPATFSIICNNVSKNDHLNWNDIQQLEKDGYDIASHSMNHTELEDISMDEVRYEISESKKCLLDNGIRQVDIFTYPKNGGSDDPLVVEEVSKHYHMARTGNDPLTFLNCIFNTTDTISEKVSCSSLGDNADFGKYSVMGWSHDADREGEGFNDDQLLQRFIEVVESQNEYNKGNEINAIPVIIYHDIETESGFYTTSTELFKAEMKYLHDNNFVVIRLMDLVS